MMSQVFLQYYQQPNETKIQRQYTSVKEYNDMSQFHKQASNCIIATLHFLLKKPQKGTRQIWSNLSES